LLKDKDEDVREITANALGKIAERLNRKGQDSLVSRIYSFRLKKKIKKKAITQIKQATGRRFIKLK